jgi:hypothetical protein
MPCISVHYTDVKIVYANVNIRNMIFGMFGY